MISNFLSVRTAALSCGPALVLALLLHSSPSAGQSAPTARTAVAAVAAPARMGDSTDRAPRGVVRAVNEATLSSRLSARIVQMPVKEGSAFKRGDLLVAFDCERTRAEARAADAAVEVQKKTVETNEELSRFNALGKHDLLISKSQLNKAAAEAEALQSQTRECKMFAPFSGRVVEQLARVHETVSGSQPLLRIVDTEDLALDLILPSSWLQWLAPGARFEFAIDETGQTMPAVVERLTPSVDPVSKTIRIIGRFDRQSRGKLTRVLPGMSGSALFASASSRPANAVPATDAAGRTIAQAATPGAVARR